MEPTKTGANIMNGASPQGAETTTVALWLKAMQNLPKKPPILSSPLSALPTIIEWETVQQEHELAPFRGAGTGCGSEGSNNQMSWTFRKMI